MCNYAEHVHKYGCYTFSRVCVCVRLHVRPHAARSRVLFALNARVERVRV